MKSRNILLLSGICTILFIIILKTQSWSENHVKLRESLSTRSFWKVPPVYVINLDRSRERWRALTRQADLQNITLTRIDAIDGNNLRVALNPFTLRTTFELSETQKSDSYTAPLYYSKGTVGCYMSHRRAWKKIAQLPVPKDVAVILEDDVMFVPNFKSRLRVLLEELDAFDASWDVLYLGMTRPSGYPVRKGSTLRRTRTGLHGHNSGCFAYVIRQKSAKKLLNSCTSNIEYMIDHCVQRHHGSLLQTYFVWPFLVNHDYSHQSERLDGKVYSPDYITASSRLH